MSPPPAAPPSPLVPARLGGTGGRSCGITPWQADAARWAPPPVGPYAGEGGCGACLSHGDGRAECWSKYGRDTGQIWVSQVSKSAASARADSGATSGGDTGQIWDGGLGFGRVWSSATRRRACPPECHHAPALRSAISRLPAGVTRPQVSPRRRAGRKMVLRVQNWSNMGAWGEYEC